MKEYFNGYCVTNQYLHAWQMEEYDKSTRFENCVLGTWKWRKNSLWYFEVRQTNTRRLLFSFGIPDKCKWFLAKKHNYFQECIQFMLSWQNGGCNMTRLENMQTLYILINDWGRQLYFFINYSSSNSYRKGECSKHSHSSKPIIFTV